MKRGPSSFLLQCTHNNSTPQKKNSNSRSSLKNNKYVYILYDFVSTPSLTISIYRFIGLYLLSQYIALDFWCTAPSFVFHCNKFNFYQKGSSSFLIRTSASDSCGTRQLSDGTFSYVCWVMVWLLGQDCFTRELRHIYSLIKTRSLVSLGHWT